MPNGTIGGTRPMAASTLPNQALQPIQAEGFFSSFIVLTTIEDTKLPPE